MAAIRGTNAIVYMGGTKVPEANEWSLDIEQEKLEKPHTFVCPSNPATQWVTRTGGYFSASLSITALYDEADDSPIDAATSDETQTVLLYPDCEAETKYFIGTFRLDFSMTASVDDYVTLDISGESAGSVLWAPNVV
jgi:hypothetical protein